MKKLLSLVLYVVLVLIPFTSIVDAEVLYLELDLSSSLQSHSQSNIVTRSVSLARLDHDMTLMNQREVESEDADSLCTQTSAAMIFQYYDEYRDGYGTITSNRG